MKKSNLPQCRCHLSLIICGIILSAKSLDAADNWGAAHGPLGGRNLHAPQVPWFSFPANSAAPLPPGTIRSGIALYFLNEFVSKKLDKADYLSIVNTEKLSADRQRELILIDYESTVAELSFDWQAFDSWRFSADWRIHFRYGGFCDGFIEWWHELLGVPNANREYYDSNRSYWNIRNESQWQGRGTVVGPGDLDLQALWSLWSNSKLSFATVFAFKVPIGRGELRFGSGYPDIGAALLLDWHPWNRWGFYLNAGIIIPLAGEGGLMVQAIPAVEFRISPDVSILTQFNIQSMPFRGEVQFTHRLFGRSTLFTLPQTNLKIGLKGHIGRFGWEAYIEEDTFTWEGPDILLYLGATWSFKAPPEAAVSPKKQFPIHSP